MLKLGKTQNDHRTTCLRVPDPSSYRDGYLAPNIYPPHFPWSWNPWFPGIKTISQPALHMAVWLSFACWKWPLWFLGGFLWEGTSPPSCCCNMAQSPATTLNHNTVRWYSLRPDDDEINMLMMTESIYWPWLPTSSEKETYFGFFLHFP